MSDEFDCSVHNFYNHTVEELKKMKKDFKENTDEAWELILNKLKKEKL